MISQSRAIRSQSRKIVKIVKIMSEPIWNFESSCDLTNASASLYDRKTAARPFDTIHDIKLSISFAQSLLKGRNAPTGTSGTKGLTVIKIVALFDTFLREFSYLNRQISKGIVVLWPFPI